MVFAAGQRLRASALNDAVPLLGYATADTTVTSSTTLVNATGLAVALAANSTYALDGFIAYGAQAAADMKVAWTVPASTTGTWGMFSLTTAATTGIDSIDARRITAYGAANTQIVGGSDGLGLMCLPRGVVITSGTAGTLQLQMAQNSSNATGNIIRIGSWIRAWKLA